MALIANRLSAPAPLYDVSLRGRLRAPSPGAQGLGQRPAGGPPGERLARPYRARLLAVADSALGHLSSLCALDGAGLKFIVPPTRSDRCCRARSDSTLRVQSAKKARRFLNAPRSQTNHSGAGSAGLLDSLT